MRVFNNLELEYLFSHATRLVDRILAQLMIKPERFAKMQEIRPPGIGIELTNICNANCIFCGYQYQERPNLIMADDIFFEVVKQYCAIGGGIVGLTCVVGDPLIDPKFVERVSYLRKQPQITNIFTITNGILLGKHGVKRILRSGLTHLSISTTHLDPEAYRRVFRSPRFGEMYHGILELLQANNELGNPIHVDLNFRLDVPVEEAINSERYQELKQYHPKVLYNQHYDNWYGLIKSELLSGTMKLRKIPDKPVPCSLLYAGLLVMSNGNVTCCGCRDLDGSPEFVLGNIRNESLLEMWHSNKLKKIRHSFYCGTPPGICSDCSHYTRFDQYGFKDYLYFVRQFKKNRESIQSGETGTIGM